MYSRLQLELELGLEFIELVEMTHGEDCRGSVSISLQCEEQLPHRAVTGNVELRIELGERLEREGTLVQAWMGQLEPRLVELEAVHQQQVEVDRARAVSWPVAHPAELPLDLEQRREEGLRRERRVHRNGCVEEPGLIEVADGIRFPERRHGDDLHGRPLSEKLDRAGEGGNPVTKVRSEPDVRACHVT